MRRFILLSVIAATLCSCSSLGDQPAPVYIVFFHRGAIEIAPEAGTALDQAAAAIRSAHPASIAIASGVATGDNLRLAEPRFNVVRQALIARGVRAEIIARSALADSKLDVGATGDTRVEILLLTKAPS